MGSREFSLIPPDGLSAVIFANSRLHLPTKFMVAYAKKQSQSAIFEWVEEERGWFWYNGDYPMTIPGSTSPRIGKSNWFAASSKVTMILTQERKKV